MDIFNRPPTIAEDTLQYTLHLPRDLSDKASVTTFAACIRTYVEDLLPGFLWHRDPFELKIVLDADPDNPNTYVLEGRMRRYRRQLPGAPEDEDRDVNTIEDEDGYISAQDAIRLVRDPSVPTFAPEPVESTVWQRISGTVKMTRTAYAQLLGQKFFPPKVFGYWSEREGSKEWRWRDIGMKIAVGFEMLYQESKSRAGTAASSTESSAEAKKDALRRNPEYNKYVQTLRSVNYFRGEIEGSELWRSLEDRAANMFIEIRKEDDARRPSFASQVNAALLHPTTTSTLQVEEDADDWLQIDSQHFETMLGSKDSVQSGPMDVDTPEEGSGDRAASEQAVKLKELATKVENFIEGEGGLEGAMFEEDAFSDEEFSDEDSETDNDEGDNEARDMAAKEAAMENLVPGIDPSEYGKMPASYHSNSQRTAPTSKTDKSEPVDEPQSQPREKPIRQPIIPRDKYDGVDSDDDTDEDEAESDESDDDRPQVANEIEIDMGEEEEEFLEFSRQALGISDDQWNDIIQDRKQRGAFLPASVKNATLPKKTTSTSPGKQTVGRAPVPGPRPNVNPNLDSFEAVMQAMDVELSRLRSGSKKGAKDPSSMHNGKGKAKAPGDDGDVDIESAMEAELRSALERDDEDDDEEPPDYNLIKNFLESFKKLEAFLGNKDEAGGRWQVVYRNYATLFFVFVVDGAESELGILDLIQVFVECLDRAFENVCELDLVFHFDEVHHILAEIIQGGLVLETNVEEIDAAVQQARKARKESFASANPLSLGMGNGIGSRGNLKTPIEWLTGKLTGVGAR
ncbi:hypothetical protein C0993_012260 [Termitomyces sp. T159_Od127]|nr:hypothetical protein C0993_012260 [Termitomyces sp. T159_Od127]